MKLIRFLIIVMGSLMFLLSSCDDGSEENNSNNNANQNNSTSNNGTNNNNITWEICETQTTKESCESLGCVFRLTNFGVLNEQSCEVTGEWKNSCIAQLTSVEENAGCSYLRVTDDATLVMALDSCVESIDGWSKCEDELPPLQNISSRNCYCDFP